MLLSRLRRSRILQLSCTYFIILKNEHKNKRGEVMGDKGGKKDKEKMNKQANKAKNSKNEASKSKQTKAR